MSCDLETGNYNVLSYRDGNAVNTCPSLAPAEVVILTNVTPVRVVRAQGPPDCIYHLYVSDGHIKPVEQDFLQAALTYDALREWTITHYPGLGAYTIVLRNEPDMLAWTDPGNDPSCHRRLRLTPLDRTPVSPPQLFRFVRVAD